MGLRLLMGIEVPLKGDLRGRMGELTIRQPESMPFAPGLALVDEVILQQKTLNSLSSLLHIIFGGMPGANESAYRFMQRIGNPNGRQLSGTSQAGKRLGIAVIVLHAVARTAQDMRRGDDPAVQAVFREISVNLVTAGPRFIDELHAPLGLSQSFYQTEQIGCRIRDVTLEPNFARSPGLRYCDGDGPLVNIEPDVRLNLVHHVSPD